MSLEKCHVEAKAHATYSKGNELYTECGGGPPLHYGASGIVFVPTLLKFLTLLKLLTLLKFLTLLKLLTC